MPRLMLLVLSGALLSVGSTEAQRFVASGDTVRIQVAGGPLIKSAVVRRWTASEVHLAGGYQVPTASILGVRVKAGRKPATRRGVLIGLAIGGAFGTAAGIATAADQSGFMTFGPEIIPISAAFFGGGGALVGAIVGSFANTDVWVPGHLAPSGAVGASRARPQITPVVAGGAESTWRIGVRLR
jgi:hypothetical protein